jgi:hypothetical protein
MRLINRSFSRLTYRDASAIGAVRWIDVADDEVLLDPFGNAPIKLFEAKADELSISVSAALKKWSPPLLLSAKQRKINAQRGSVLVLGRSGTGKTYYLVNRMQSDARAAASFSSSSSSSDKEMGNAFSQLFVTRSARLCELVKYLYRDGDEKSASNQRADFRTLEQFISHMEIMVCAMDQRTSSSRRTFPKNRNVDFAYFRDAMYPRITTSKVSFLGPTYS